LSEHLSGFGAGCFVHSNYDLGVVASGIGFGDDRRIYYGRGTGANRIPGLFEEKYGTNSKNITSANTSYFLVEGL